MTLGHVHGLLGDTVSATIEVTSGRSTARGGKDWKTHSTQAHLLPEAEANTNVRSGRGDQARAFSIVPERERVKKKNKKKMKPRQQFQFQQPAQGPSHINHGESGKGHRSPTIVMVTLLALMGMLRYVGSTPGQ